MPRHRDAGAARGDTRWIALVSIISLAQLMVALDATIVSIALPSAQAALHVSDAGRQWVVTAYTLAFGGLLLLGGRIADGVGRRRTFVAGLLGFGVASALGGSAPGYGALLAARALQGVSAALVAPAALSLLAVSFTEARERAKAFAVYGAIAGSGAAVGLLLGGVLTEYLDWRWCLYVNVPVAIVAAAGGWRLLPPAEAGRRQGLDVQGAVLATGGLAALVYACTAAVSEGWGSRVVISLLLASALLLLVFAVRQGRAAAPLLPPGIVLDRSRGGAYLSVTLGISGKIGAFLFLTYYFRVVLGYSPLRAGLAFLPTTLATQLGAWAIAGRLMPRVPPRAIMAPGGLIAAAGMALLTRLPVDGGYLAHVLPAEVLLGAGISCVMAPAISTGTFGVDPRQAGVAAAVVNTAQLVGGSLGTAVLNTIATSATAGFLAAHRSSQATTQAIVHGYAVATAWGTVILVTGAAVALIMISAGGPARRERES